MKNIHVIGGGTFVSVRNHFALSAPAFGQTARELSALFREYTDPAVWNVQCHLTQMAGGSKSLHTNDDVAALLDSLVADPATKIIIMNAALCDWEPTALSQSAAPWDGHVLWDGHGERLKTRQADGQPNYLNMGLKPAQKVLTRVRQGLTGRKDIFLVAFKTTTGASSQEQYVAGLHLLKESSANLVLANDTITRNNMVVVPEESFYHQTTNRTEVLQGLVTMTLARADLHFTRSTVVGTTDDLVAWQDPRVPDNLRTVVDHAIARGAYKPFRGSTAGHFAVKLSDHEFLTSIRKRDFNRMAEVGLVFVESDGLDRVVAHGAKPSVGGQSQRIIFKTHKGYDCIFHAHVPLRPDAGKGTDGYGRLNIVPQWPRECGSHECGEATSAGLVQVAPGIKAVMLENHGPNVVFERSVPAERVVGYLEATFDLSGKTGGELL